MPAGGVAAFAAAYGLFATSGAAIAVLAVPFLLVGLGIGAVETAQHSAVAALGPKDLRGSAFGLPATVQLLGNASAIGGIVWTAISPAAAFAYLAAWMLLALAGPASALIIVAILAGAVRGLLTLLEATT